MGRPKLKDKRFCYICGATDCKNTKGWASWITNIPTNLFLCKNCYSKHIYYPTQNHDKTKPRNKKRLKFKDKTIYLKENPRKGICQWCKKKLGDSYIDYLGNVKRLLRTVMHHFEYDVSDPLNGTIELCDQCHRNEHIRLLSS